MRPLIILAFCAFSSPALAQDAPKGDASAGKKIFAAVGCYQCHGYVGQGSLTAGGRRLTPDPMPYEGFAAYVREPTGEMPPYGPKILADQQIADIYAYLLALPPPPARNSVTLLND